MPSLIPVWAFTMKKVIQQLDQFGLQKQSSPLARQAVCAEYLI